MQDDVAKSSSFIYVSALSQMYTYLLYCPDIQICPWVVEMLKKNWSGYKDAFEHTDNVKDQCLVILHSPTIINMTNLKEAIDKADEDIDSDTDDKDDNKVEFNGYDEHWSSIVVVTGCLFTVYDGRHELQWEHSLPTDAFYTQFLHLQEFLINIAVNGSLLNTRLDTVVVDTESFTFFKSLLKNWITLTPAKDVMYHRATIEPENNTWDISGLPTIKSLIDQQYTVSVRNDKRRTMDLKSTFKFPNTRKRCIDTNAVIIDVDNNIDNSAEYDTENDIVCTTAKRVSLDMAKVIELLYEEGPNEMTHFSNSYYSVEDIASSQARIKFNCQIDEDGHYKKFECNSFVLSCKCCGCNVFTNIDTHSGMDDILKVLQDAMFCHFFKGVLPSINEYLFDTTFDNSLIKPCNNADHVQFLDALMPGKASDESIKNIQRVHHAIFQRQNTQDVHPFVKVMCSILYKALPSTQTKGEIDQTYMCTVTENILLPSQKCFHLYDAIPDKVQPGIKPDDALMKQLKFITMIDWSKNDDFKQLSNLLPEGDKWACLTNLVGEGKEFPYFHCTGLLPYLMNKKNKNSECKLTNVYNTYPPASWTYACACANKLIDSVVYIAETHIKSIHYDTLIWIRKQKDIIELREETIEGVDFHVFQFVLSDDMVRLYFNSIKLLNLEHKQRTPVSKRMRAEIRLNSDSYKSKHEHNITVTSTYPFRAKETSTSNNRSNNNDVMKWMDVRLLIDSIYGGDTSKVCLLTQLLSSPCFIETGILYTKDSTCQGCPKESETSTQEHSIEEQPHTVVGGGNHPASVGVGVESRCSSKRNHDSVSHPANKKPGSINTKPSPGYRLESKTEVYPRSNNHSHKLIQKLSTISWNCLYGNTHNTMHALGHGIIFKKITTPETLDNNNNFSTLVQKLNKQCGYCIALSRLMTKNDSLKFKELEKCINKEKVPTLIILNMTYSGNQSRRHLIGIVPSVMIDNKTEMHIVDGYNKEQKSFPLNEDNFKWCCSGCVSYFIEQFVFFTPGKQILRNLHSNDNSCGTYAEVKSFDALQAIIPMEYRNQTKKRKR